MATYLITGVAGFIGSHLAEALLARGHSVPGSAVVVRGIDDLSTGSIANIPRGVDFIQTDLADLADTAALARACRGVDAILHQAALPSVQRSIEDPLTSHNANVNGTLNLLEAARAAGVRRVLYAASSSAYGNQPGFPRVETMAPQPLSPYAVQKLTGELYMQSYAHVYGMETVCLRYFNIFGPRQAPDSPYSGVIARFALQMLRATKQLRATKLLHATNPAGDPASDLDAQPVTLHGDGEQTRDFTFIENVVRANLLALDAPAARDGHAPWGHVFNVACGRRHSLNQVFRALARLTGYALPPQYTQPRPGDVHDSLADISAARIGFGYEPTVDLETGLARTVAWYRQQLEAASVQEARA